MDNSSTDFYLVLPSNSSMDHFPDNTMSQYVTKLPSEIRLTGNWKVGLSSCLFPNDFTLPKETFYLTRIHFNTPLTDPNVPLLQQKYTTEEKFFENPKEIVTHLNEICNASPLQPDQEKLKFSINRENYVTIFIPPQCELDLSPRMQRILGFTKWNIARGTNISEKATLQVRGTSPATTFQLYTIYVYTDLVQPNVVGDSVVPLLEIIPVDANASRQKMNSVRLDKPRYVPLLQKSIKHPKIELMSDDGGPIPFSTFGRVVVTLHFKRA